MARRTDIDDHYIPFGYHKDSQSIHDPSQTMAGDASVVLFVAEKGVFARAMDVLAAHSHWGFILLCDQIYGI